MLSLECYFEKDIVKFEHYGNRNQNRILYYIDLDEQYKNSGFGVLFKQMLVFILFAEKHSFQPVVRFGTHLLYAEQDDDNIFEKYFQLKSGMKQKEVFQSRNVVKAKQHDLDFFEGNSYSYDDKDIAMLAEVLNKYVIWNDTVGTSIRKEYERLCGKKRVLGVHIRATDFNFNYKNHPTSVSVNQYLDITENMLERRNYPYVFVATDSAEVIEQCRERLGDKVLYYADTFRSENEQAIHYGKNTEKVRKNHRFLLGYEVLRDIVTLSKCESVILSKSNVGICARIINQAYNPAFEECLIVDNGMNTKGKKFRR